MKAKNSTATAADDEQTANFEPGSKVMAKWKDEFYYGAYVIRQVMKDDQLADSVKLYEIRYTDKVKRIVRAENLRAPTQDELVFAFDTSLPPQPPTPTPSTTANTTTKSAAANSIPSDLPQIAQDSTTTTTTPGTGETQRRAEAELLLAMQQAQQTAADPASAAVVETKPADKSNEVVGGVASGEEMNPPSMPSLQLAPGSSVGSGDTPAIPATPSAAAATTPSAVDSNRKSLRVKRLRTYTEEIVFDSPSASIAYNLASVHKQTSVSSTADLGASFSSSTGTKKRKT